MKKNLEISISLRAKLTAIVLAVLLIGLIGFCFIPVSPQLQAFQQHTKGALFVMGQVFGWMVYFVITYVTQEIFFEAKTIKNKLLAILVELLGAGVMVLAYFLIDEPSGLNEALEQSSFLLMVAMWWLYSWYQRRKMIKALKTENQLN